MKKAIPFIILALFICSCKNRIDQKEFNEAMYKKPVNPGDETEIKIEVTPDMTGYFRKYVTVFCNIEEGSMQLTVKGKTEM